MLELYRSELNSNLMDWIFNYKMYIVVMLLLFAGRLIPAKKSFSSNSIFLDYLYGLLSKLVFEPLIIASFILISSSIDIKYKLFSGMDNLEKIILLLLIGDFLLYFSHYIRHKVPIFFLFHSIHHSQKYLNPLTTKRNHPIEGAFVRVIFIYMPTLFVDTNIEVWFWLIAIDNVHDYFVHSNLRIRFPKYLRYIIVSPQFHRIHHSIDKKHFDKNFGVRFSIWDNIFQTANNENIYPETGISDPELLVEADLKNNIFGLYFKQFMYPFKKIYKQIQDK